MKNFRGAALAAGVGTPESVPHESEQDSFDFKHRNSRTENEAAEAAGGREGLADLEISSRRRRNFVVGGQAFPTGSSVMHYHT